MRKGVAERKMETVTFNLGVLGILKERGYKYVQVKGLTIDRHYDYIEPHFLILTPFTELLVSNAERGIYESLESELLFQWATEINEFTEILIGKCFVN